MRKSSWAGSVPASGAPSLHAGVWPGWTSVGPAFQPRDTEQLGSFPTAPAAHACHKFVDGQTLDVGVRKSSALQSVVVVSHEFEECAPDAGCPLSDRQIPHPILWNSKHK